MSYWILDHIVLPQVDEEKVKQILSRDLPWTFGPLTIRDPMRSYMVDYIVDEWHHDCSNAQRVIARGCDFLLLWSNVCSTELLLPNGTVMDEIEDGSLLLVDNHKVQHRVPHRKSTERWFGRRILNAQLGEELITKFGLKV